MAENTKIQWATHTFNPWRGCTKIAPGCANCYADTQSKRNPKTLGIWGPNGTRVVASEAMWREPLKWDREAATCERMNSKHFPGLRHERPRVFCASLADVFEDWCGSVVNSRGDRLENWLGAGRARTPMSLDDVRARLFRLIDSTPNLDWLLLTKRPENARRMWPEFELGRWDATGRELPRNHRRHNVWLGTSIACQEDADRNVPELTKCRDLCAKTFLSIEPLIGPVDLSRWLHANRCQSRGGGGTNDDGSCFTYQCGLPMGHGGAHSALIPSGSPWFHGRSPDWVIVGGESGPAARSCDVDWIRSIVWQCRDAGVPCFVKQLGSRPVGLRFEMDEQGRPFCVEGNNFRGRARPLDPKGGDPAEWPEDVRVREVPS